MDIKINVIYSLELIKYDNNKYQWALSIKLSNFQVE